MPAEFTLLGAVLVLAIGHILAAAHGRTRQYGTKWNLGPRDAPMPPLDPLAGRLARAQANLFETLPLFVGALLGAAAAGRLGWKTEVGSQLFFWARVLYLPLYAAGVPILRTIVWGLSLVGLVLIIWALIFG